jgi:hypothetical protein
LIDHLNVSSNIKKKEKKQNDSFRSSNHNNSVLNQKKHSFRSYNDIASPSSRGSIKHDLPNLSFNRNMNGVIVRNSSRGAQRNDRQ